ncbi:MAG: hypothetical protein MO852_15405, partial [Candidatus Devosia euplotis]|nr:hypothetical protein [Candidatus Devosia euplotis]
MSQDKHSHHSVLREVILEHLLVDELLRTLWQRNIIDAEILRSEFDGSGYDLFVSRNLVTRHVQLKVTVVGGACSTADANLALLSKPSGCIIWMFVTETLLFDHFYWFGDQPGYPMPNVDTGKVVRHTKGNSKGEKLERPNLREVRKSAFERVSDIGGLLEKLLGEAGRWLCRHRSPPKLSKIAPFQSWYLLCPNCCSNCFPRKSPPVCNGAR